MASIKSGHFTYSKSIGYTAPITKTSVGISQSSGNPVNGNYYQQTQQPSGAGKVPERVQAPPRK
jgi:hypothetical protein